MREDYFKLKKYHSWLQISRKLRGILHPYTDEETKQEIVDQLFTSLNKPKKKPRISELSCQVCNDPNPVWFTLNKLWNNVIKDKYHFVCPNCFIKLAERKGLQPQAWKLTTVNGRSDKP